MSYIFFRHGLRGYHGFFSFFSVYWSMNGPKIYYINPWNLCNPCQIKFIELGLYYTYLGHFYPLCGWKHPLQSGKTGGVCTRSASHCMYQANTAYNADTVLSSIYQSMVNIYICAVYIMHTLACSNRCDCHCFLRFTVISAQKGMISINII